MIQNMAIVTMEDKSEFLCGLSNSAIYLEGPLS